MKHETLEDFERRRRRPPTVRRLDIKDVRSGSLVAVRPALRSQHGTILWLCQCDCGEVTMVVASMIARGKTRSCGRGKCNSSYRRSRRARAA